MNRTLTAADMSRQLGRRRSEAPRINQQFSLATSLKMIGSAKYVLFPTFNILAHVIYQSLAVRRRC